MQRRTVVLAFGLLAAALIATAPPRRVGDGREYLAMAMNLARLSPPALSGADASRIERELDAIDFAGPPLIASPQLRDRFGRQDFVHFWFYPALAVPGVWLSRLAGVHPNYGLAALNVLLFMGAVWIASGRLAWYVTAALFCSPVIWWIDKSHTETFTFSLLAVALVLVLEAPWWSMLCLAAASTQNPPIGALVPAAALTALTRQPGIWRDRRFRTGGLIAGTIALLHPLYYWWRLDLPMPLLHGTDPRVPTVQELGATLWDPNVGLLFHAPLLALIVVAGAVAVAVRRPSRLVEPDVWLAVAGGGLFLFSFAQTTNVNSGATPGMSRYAVWLVPLAIPVLQRAAQVVSTPSRRWLAPIALASCAWSVVAFHPGRPEAYLAPTRVADLLWTRWPSFTNPLPEIFAERLSGQEPGLGPISTPGCAKVLTIAGEWPVPCWPREPAPAACRAPRAFCYANLEGGRYRFVHVRPPRVYRFSRQTWTWTPGSAPSVERILGRLRWRDLRRVGSGRPGAMVRAAYEVSWTDELQSDQDLVVFVSEPKEGARLMMRLPGSMAGALLDPETGNETETIRIETRPWDLVTFPLPAGHAVVVALRRIP